MTTTSRSEAKRVFQPVHDFLQRLAGGPGRGLVEESSRQLAAQLGEQRLIVEAVARHHGWVLFGKGQRLKRRLHLAAARQNVPQERNAAQCIGRALITVGDRDCFAQRLFGSREITHLQVGDPNTVQVGGDPPFVAQARASARLCL